MATITFNIPNNKAQDILDAFDYENSPVINTGTPEEPIFEKEYTQNQWVKRCIRRWVISKVAKYKHTKAVREIPYSEDDNLLT